MLFFLFSILLKYFYSEYYSPPYYPSPLCFFGWLSEGDEMAVDVFLFAPTAFSVVVWYSCAVRSFRGHTRRLFHVLHISPQVGAVTPVDAVAPCAACLTLICHGLKWQVVLGCLLLRCLLLLLLLLCASSKELHVLRMTGERCPWLSILVDVRPSLHVATDEHLSPLCHVLGEAFVTVTGAVNPLRALHRVALLVLKLSAHRHPECDERLAAALYDLRICGHVADKFVLFHVISLKFRLCGVVIYFLYSCPPWLVIVPWWAFFCLLGQLLANLLMQDFQLPSANPYVGRAEENMVLATLTDYSHVIFLTHLHLRNMLL